MKNGEISKGYGQLVSGGEVVRMTPDRVKQLAVKMKSSRPDAWKPNDDGTPNELVKKLMMKNRPRAKVNIETLKTMKTRLSVSTSPGIDGLDVGTMNFFFHPQTLLKYVNVCANGFIPPEVVKWLFGSNLTALNKPASSPTKEDSLRPITPPGIVFRLCASARQTELKEPIIDTLGPWQLCVFHPNGCEAAAIMTRTNAEKHPESALNITEDGVNGYGETERDMLVETIDTNLPGLSRLTYQNYGPEVECHHIQYRDGDGFMAVHKVGNGMLQGDGEAPVGYTALSTDTREYVNREVLQNGRYGSMCDYIDDGIHTGHAEGMTMDDPNFIHPVVQSCITKWQRNEGKGIFVHHDKITALAATTGITQEMLKPIEDYLRDRAIRMPHMPLPDDWEMPKMQYMCNSEDGIKQLGVPIGGDGYVQRLCSKKATKIVAAAKKLVGVSAQTEYQYLRYCALTGYTHLARTVPWRNLEAGVGILEDYFRNEDTGYLWRLLRNDCLAITPDAERLKAASRLPMADGGLDLRHLALTSQYAYLAGVADALNSPIATKVALSTEIQSLRGRTSALWEDLQQHLDSCRSLINMPENDPTGHAQFPPTDG